MANYESIRSKFCKGFENITLNFLENENASPESV